MKMLKIGLIVFFALLSLGQLQRFQITPQVAVYAHEFVLGFLICLFFPSILKQYQTLIGKTVKHKAAMFFFCYVIVQVIIYQVIEFNVVSLLYLLRLCFYLNVFFLVTIALESHQLSQKSAYWLLCGMSWLISILGLLQYFLIPDTRMLYWLGWDDHYFRLISTLFDPNFTGLVIGVGITLYLLIFFEEQHFFQRFYFLFPSVLALLLTYSRASYLAFIATILFTVIKDRKWRQIIVILAVLISIPFLPRPASEGVRLERTASILSRINSNQSAIQSLSLSEVAFGRGLFTQLTQSNNGLPNHAVAPDNSFIFLFISLGVIGVGLLLLTLFSFRRYVFATPLSETVLIVSIHSLFNNSLFYIWTMVILYTVLAVQIKQKITA